MEGVEFDSELIEVGVCTSCLVETSFTHVEGLNLSNALLYGRVKSSSLSEELVESLNIAEALDMLEGILISGEILEELFLLSVKLGNELLFLVSDGGVTVSDGFSDDHGVLLECPAVLDIVNLVHKGEIIEQLVVVLDFFLEGQHFTLGYFLRCLDELSEFNELLFVFGTLADSLLHVVVGS